MNNFYCRCCFAIVCVFVFSPAHFSLFLSLFLFISLPFQQTLHLFEYCMRSEPMLIFFFAGCLRCLQRILYDAVSNKFLNNHCYLPINTFLMNCIHTSQHEYAQMKSQKIILRMKLVAFFM